MSNITFRKILIIFSLLILFFLSNPLALASLIDTDVFDDQDQSFQGAAGYEDAGPTAFATIVGVVIQALLSLLGVIFVSLMIYAGYNWMIARGEEEKVTRAKDTLRRAIIGLVITIGAYAISYWVILRLLYK